jgi:hypothetical protein
MEQYGNFTLHTLAKERYHHDTLQVAYFPRNFQLFFLGD